MSPPDIDGIIELSEELDRLKKEQEEVITEINKIHKKLQLSPEVVENPDDKTLSSLKSLYIHAKELSENEADVSDQLLGQLNALLSSSTRTRRGRTIGGNAQKKRRIKSDKDIPTPSPIIPSSQLDSCASLKWEQVAAKFTPNGADEDEWFVVRVLNFDRETKEFEVIDEEPSENEDDDDGQKKYILPISHIIPFPKRIDLGNFQDYPPGRRVLALYPETTALYKATVVNTHRKRKTEDYLLEFDDDEAEDGTLPQRKVPFNRVVALPPDHDL